MSDIESSVRLESALSVAHDLVDTIIHLKADSKLLGDRVDQNAHAAKSIIDERERQIAALVEECNARDAKINELEQNQHPGANEEIASLRQSVLDWKAEALELRRQINERDQEVDEYTANIKAADRRSEGFMAEIVERDSRISALQAQIAELEKKVPVATTSLWPSKKKR